MDLETVLYLYFLVINIIGIALMGIDKSKAKRKAWRIPEKTLLLCALFGGSAGVWIGMYLFHHKTKHWQFVVGVPLILILQAVCVICIRFLF